MQLLVKTGKGRRACQFDEEETVKMTEVLATRRSSASLNNDGVDESVILDRDFRG